MGSRFSSILPINVINVAVSADRAMLDNQTGIKFEFLRLAPHEAHGKTFEGKQKTVETQRGICLCQKSFVMIPKSSRVLPTTHRSRVTCSSARSAL